jgi:hypothetical protein
VGSTDAPSPCHSGWAYMNSAPRPARDRPNTAALGLGVHIRPRRSKLAVRAGFVPGHGASRRRGPRAAKTRSSSDAVSQQHASASRSTSRTSRIATGGETFSATCWFVASRSSWTTEPLLLPRGLASTSSARSEAGCSRLNGRRTGCPSRGRPPGHARAAIRAFTAA